MCYIVGAEENNAEPQYGQPFVRHFKGLSDRIHF